MKQELLRERIESLRTQLKKEIRSNRDYVREIDLIMGDLQYCRDGRIYAGDDFSIDINSKGYLKMETSYSNQEISIYWIERLQRLYKIVDDFNVETVEFAAMEAK